VGLNKRRSFPALLFVARDLRRLEMEMRAAWIPALLFLSLTAVADEALWNKLQQDPHMVVLVRNAESAGNRDGANMFAWDSTGKCTGESTLTATGRTRARKYGSVFAMRGVTPVVISSPVCRCTETAQIACGRCLTDPGLRQRPPEDRRGQEAFLNTASALLGKQRGNLPVVFVNHRFNIDVLTMELIDTGELLAGTVTEDGEIEVLGNIRLEMWENFLAKCSTTHVPRPDGLRCTSAAG